MSPLFSNHLNLLRALAAFIVVLSHFAYPRFSRGDYLFIRDWNLGSDAVVLFFVLSGYVIAYTTFDKDRTLGRYLFARFTRLYSVIFPALILTLILDTAGNAINPLAYDGWWWNPAGIGETLFHGLSFTTEWVGQGFRPGTNGPFWSVSYEAAYYLVFGIVAFMTGLKRLITLFVVLAIVGIKPLALIPVWLMGVWFYYRAEEIVINQRSAVVLSFMPLIIYAMAIYADVPLILLGISNLLFGGEKILSLRFSNEFIWNAFLGCLVTMHLVGMRTLLKNKVNNVSPSQSISWLAGGTFSIYIMHYPLLQFVDAALTDGMNNYLRDSILLGITILGCLIFASVFERTLPKQRQWLLEFRSLPEARQPQ